MTTGNLLLFSSATATRLLCAVNTSARCKKEGLFFSSRGLHKSTNAAKMSENKSTVPSIVVYVSVPNKELGKKLAESIVKKKLAACVKRVPGVESVYEWEGKVQTDSEELLIIKTRHSLLTPLTNHVKQNHNYKVPEVVALPIVGGNEEYLEWVKAVTKD